MNMFKPLIMVAAVALAVTTYIGTKANKNALVIKPIADLPLEPCTIVGFCTEFPAIPCIVGGNPLFYVESSESCIVFAEGEFIPE